MSINIAVNPVTGKSYSEKVSSFFSEQVLENGYLSNEWLTRSQADKVGRELFYKLNTKKGMKLFSEKGQSGIRPGSIPVKIRFFIKGTCKSTGKETSFPKVVEYYNIQQCYGH